MKRKYLIYGIVFLGLLGVADASYLSWIKVRAAVDGQVESPICSAFSKSGCDIALSSEWSTLFGVPISLIGLCTYLIVIGLGVLLLLGRLKRFAPGALLLVSAGSVLSSLGLAWYSFSQSSWCPFCVGLYGINTALLIATAWLVGWKLASVRDAVLGVFRSWQVLGATTFLFVALVSLSGVGYAALVERMAGTRAERDSKRVQDALKLGRLPMPVDDAPRLGPAGAKHTLVKFSDFQCPYCQKLWSQLESLREAYPDDLRIAFRNYPLSNVCNPFMDHIGHPRACAAAYAAMCAHEQGRFWEMGALIFENQRELSDEDLRVYATKAELDGAAFERCMSGDAVKMRVRRDVLIGTIVGIPGTPATVINGYRFMPPIPKVSFDDITAALARHEAAGTGHDNAGYADIRATLGSKRHDVPPSPRAMPSEGKTNGEVVVFADPMGSDARAALYHHSAFAERFVDLRFSVRLYSDKACSGANAGDLDSCAPARLIACAMDRGRFDKIAKPLALSRLDDLPALITAADGEDGAVSACLASEKPGAILSEDRAAFTASQVDKSGAVFILGRRPEGTVSAARLMRLLAGAILQRDGVTL